MMIVRHFSAGTVYSADVPNALSSISDSNCPIPPRIATCRMLIAVCDLEGAYIPEAQLYIKRRWYNTILRVIVVRSPTDP